MLLFCKHTFNFYKMQYIGEYTLPPLKEIIFMDDGFTNYPIPS